MNVRNMEYIDALAREGSLTAAGKRLGVSQPTLSAFLSGLERELGTDLFLREKKKLLPTPAGKIYIQAARQILQVKEQTVQGIRKLSGEFTDRIRVGATPLRGSMMFANCFPAFSLRYPDVKLEIQEAYMGGLKGLVRNNQVTCSFGSCYDSEDPYVDILTISREEVILGVPAFHPLAAQAAAPGEPLTQVEIEQVADMPFVLLAKGTTVRVIADHIFSGAGITPTVVFETNNNLVLDSMIHRGVGAGFLPISSMVSAPQEAVYFSLNPRYYLSLCIFFPKGKILTEAERYLIYLAARLDQSNPLYTFQPDERIRRILQEFSDTKENGDP